MIMRLAATAVLLLAPLSTTAFAAEPYAVGARSGPFVVTERSLTDLVKDGYEIRGNLGTALVLQKAASVFSCMIPPDPQHLSYQPFFVCSELMEEPREGAAAPAKSGIAPGSH